MEDTYKKYKKYSKRAEVYNYVILGIIVFIWIILFKLFMTIGNNQSYETNGIIFAIFKSIFCSIILYFMYIILCINIKSLDSFTATILPYRLLFQKKTSYKGLNFYIKGDEVYPYYGERGIRIKDGLVNSTEMDNLISYIVRDIEKREIKSKKYNRNNIKYN